MLADTSSSGLLGQALKQIRMRFAQPLKVLHKHNFVVCFVVDEFVHESLSHQQAESTGPKILFSANIRVGEWLVWCVSDGGVLKIFRTEAGPRILNPVQEHPSGAQTGDADFPFRVQSSAPFNRVHEQFAEGSPYGFADAFRKTRVERR